MKIYNEDFGYLDTIKSVGWIAIIVYSYILSNVNYILYIGILPLLIITINLWKLKDKKEIIAIDNDFLLIKSNHNVKIESKNINKIHIELEDKDKSKFYCNMNIAYMKNNYELETETYESYKFISFIKEKYPLIRIVDKRVKNYTKQKKDFKNDIWENVIGFIIAGIFLITVLYNYDGFVNRKSGNPTTNVKIGEHLITFINSLGGKNLLIIIFGYLMLIFGINSLIANERK